MIILAKLTTNQAWIVLAIGIGLLVLGLLATFFFVWFKRRKKEEKDTFKTLTSKQSFFRFWQYYGIVIVMLVGYVGSLVTLGIAIGKFIG